MSSSPFSTLLSTAEIVAEEWPESHPEISPQRPEHERYIAASKLLMWDVKTRVNLPEKLVNHNAEFGMQVLFRVCLFAGLLAQKEEMDLLQLESILNKEESFQDIAKIASMAVKPSWRTKAEYGIVPTNYPYDPFHLQQASLEDGTLQLIGIDTAMIQHKNNVAEEHPGEKIDGICGAHSHDVLAKLFRVAVGICVKDQNLFAKTLTL